MRVGPYSTQEGVASEMMGPHAAILSKHRGV